MFNNSIDLNWLLPGGTQTVLERIMIADNLISKGYSPSKLKELPHQVVKNLIGGACLSTAIRSVRLGLL